MKLAAKRQKGFTIVELLIVIVVIGILAAIVIVAYTGIQVRAENDKTITGVASWVKIIRQYAVQSSDSLLPIDTSYPCLGDTTTISRCGNMNDSTNTCGGGATSPRTGFIATMKTISPTLPAVSVQQMNCGGRMYSGAWYFSNDGATGTVTYYLRGSQSCQTFGGSSVTTQVIDDTTWCRISLVNG